MLGLINGVLTAYLRIPSFITTLAALSRLSRRRLHVQQRLAGHLAVSPHWSPSSTARSLGIPLPLFYVVVLYALAFWFLRYTVWGASIYAVGGNPNAARLSGIDVRATQLIAFRHCRADGGDRRGADGGAAQFRLTQLRRRPGAFGHCRRCDRRRQPGGRPRQIINTVIGAMTIVIVQNALNLNAVPTSVQNVVIGAIIVLAVGIDMWRAEIVAAVCRLVISRIPSNLINRGSSMAPVSFSHIGITVPDLEKAVDFYTKALRPLS